MDRRRPSSANEAGARRDGMSGRERVSAADAAWLHMDRPTNLMVINVVLWFDTPLDWTVLTKRIESRWVDQYPRFRQRVVEGRLGLLGPQWEDDPRFALENHLHRLALPAPGDQDALQDFVGDQMGVPLDRTKPLWQVYLVEGYGSGCAVVIRVHHSLADGIALAQAVWSLTDDAPELPAEEDNDRDRGRQRSWPSPLTPLTPVTRPAGDGRDVVAGHRRSGDLGPGTGRAPDPSRRRGRGRVGRCHGPGEAGVHPTRCPHRGDRGDRGGQAGAVVRPDSA